MMPGSFHQGDLRADYRQLVDGLALIDRSYRGLLEISGADRLSWLHNLTTNNVKSLSPGDGNYAFACNVQGRILFDLDVLVREDCVWVDLDRRFLTQARTHFEKYLVVEDVNIVDQSDTFVRIGLTGSALKDGLEKLNVPYAANLPLLGTAKFTLGGVAVELVRTDFCGPCGVELLVPAADAVRIWESLSDSSGPAAVPVGEDAVQIRRIEAGIPWPGREITDEYLPAETRQLQRAVSFNKGCYLGQEVVERMRSRGVVARQLAGVRMNQDALPPAGAIMLHDEKQVGLVTSTCRSIGLRAPIALGYVKSAASDSGTPVTIRWDAGSTEATVTALPFVGGAAH